jgi:hypothetical protein
MTITDTLNKFNLSEEELPRGTTREARQKEVYAEFKGALNVIPRAEYEAALCKFLSLNVFESFSAELKKQVVADFLRVFCSEHTSNETRQLIFSQLKQAFYDHYLALAETRRAADGLFLQRCFESECLQTAKDVRRVINLLMVKAVALPRNTAHFERRLKAYLLEVFRKRNTGGQPWPIVDRFKLAHACSAGGAVANGLSSAYHRWIFGILQDRSESTENIPGLVVYGRFVKADRVKDPALRTTAFFEFYILLRAGNSILKEEWLGVCKAELAGLGVELGSNTDKGQQFIKLFQLVQVIKLNNKHSAPKAAKLLVAATPAQCLKLARQGLLIGCPVRHVRPVLKKVFQACKNHSSRAKEFFEEIVTPGSRLNQCFSSVDRIGLFSMDESAYLIEARKELAHIKRLEEGIASAGVAGGVELQAVQRQPTHF